MENPIIIGAGNQVGIVAAPISAPLAERFIRFCDATRATLTAYRTALRCFFRFLGGESFPTRETVLLFRQDIGNRYKPCTVSLYIAAVRLFFRWTAQEGLYPNIADHIKGAKLSREHKRDYLTAGQVQEVLQTAEGSDIKALRDKAIIALMATAGLRRVEVARADVADIRTIGGETVLMVQGKGQGEKAEPVVISTGVDKMLRAYLAQRQAGEGEPLFVSHSNNHQGQRIDVRSISEIVKAHLNQAGFISSRLTAHSLRHTAITNLLLAGASAQKAQAFARHADISTTMIYAHNINKTATRAECSAILDKLFLTKER